MKKLILIFIFTASLLGCDFTRFDFGMSYGEVLKYNNNDLPKAHNINEKFSFITFDQRKLCGDISKYDGLDIQYIFLEEKLVQIKINNFNDNKVLLGELNRKYNEADNEKLINKEDDTFALIWDKKDTTVAYFYSKLHFIKESLEITSKKFDSLFEKFNNLQELGE